MGFNSGFKGLMQFGINYLWLHLSCVEGEEKVTSLARHHSCVWLHYIRDIITRLMQYWLFLPKWVRNVYLHHLVQSKWKFD